MNTLAAFDVSTFAQLYGVCRATAYKEIAEGRLSAKKIGRRTLIRAVDAEAWLESRPALNLTGKAA